VTICLDLNYRSKLWSPAQAGPVLAGLVARADIVFATEPEAQLVVDGTGPAGLGRALAALAAGYLSTLLDGGGPAKRLATGALAGAFAVTVPGDWEGLPHPADLELLAAQEGVLR